MNNFKKLWNKVFNKNVKEEYSTRDSRRSFTVTQKKQIWYAQDGLCNICGEELDMRTVIYDHKKRWSDGGRSDTKNGQALCPICNNMKNFKEAYKSAEARKRKGSARTRKKGVKK